MQKRAKHIAIWASVLAVVLLLLGFVIGHYVFPPRLGPSERVAPRSPESSATLETNTVFRVHTAEKIIALTFDDGPSVKWTPQILAILQKHKAKATFFEIGSFVQKHPEITRKIAEANMEIGVHEWEHRDVMTLPFSEYKNRLQHTIAQIAKASGRTPTLFRPPYGRLDSPALYISAQYRLTNVLWSDHITGSAAWQIAKQIANSPKPGSIILCHDGRSDPKPALLPALDWFIADISKQGYKFVTVSELLAAKTISP